MRERERRLRETLEHTHKLGRELGDRGHYHKLYHEALTRWEPLVPRLKDLVDKRPDILGACALAHLAIQRECESLQAKVDQLAGKPAAPSLLEQVEPLLGQLPDKQAAALRLVAALHAAAPAQAPEDAPAFRHAVQWLHDFEDTVTAMERESALMAEIARERVKRGWVDEKTVVQYEGQLAKGLEALSTAKDALEKTREYVASTVKTYEDLRARRAELRKQLGTT